VALRVGKYFDVTCDGCARSVSTDWGRGMAQSAAAIRAVAREIGFAERHGRTLCPDCIAQGGPAELVEYGDCVHCGSPAEGRVIHVVDAAQGLDGYAHVACHIAQMPEGPAKDRLQRQLE